jgi:hypothetical protein
VIGGSYDEDQKSTLFPALRELRDPTLPETTKLIDSVVSRGWWKLAEAA